MTPAVPTSITMAVMITVPHKRFGAPRHIPLEVSPVGPKSRPNETQTLQVEVPIKSLVQQILVKEVVTMNW